jgi:hypothetical protein
MALLAKTPVKSVADFRRDPSNHADTNRIVNGDKFAVAYSPTGRPVRAYVHAPGAGESEVRLRVAFRTQCVVCYFL